MYVAHLVNRTVLPRKRVLGTFLLTLSACTVGVITVVVWSVCASVCYHASCYIHVPRLYRIAGNFGDVFYLAN